MYPHPVKRNHPRRKRFWSWKDNKHFFLKLLPCTWPYLSKRGKHACDELPPHSEVAYWWPEPVRELSSHHQPHQPFEKVQSATVPEQNETIRECGLFRLPLEIRLAIYDLALDFGDIHLARICYKHRSTATEYRLEAYPCFAADAERRRKWMCNCLTSHAFAYLLYGNMSWIPETRYPTSTAAPKGGLREVMNLMYTSRAL